MKSMLLPLERPKEIMDTISNKMPKVRRALQPPLSCAEATADSDRARKSPFADPPWTDHELKEGDLVEGQADLGKRTGETGKAEETNVENAVVERNDDGWQRLQQRFSPPFGVFVHTIVAFFLEVRQ